MVERLSRYLMNFYVTAPRSAPAGPSATSNLTSPLVVNVPLPRARSQDLNYMRQMSTDATRLPEGMPVLGYGKFGIKFITVYLSPRPSYEPRVPLYCANHSFLIIILKYTLHSLLNRQPPPRSWIRSGPIDTSIGTVFIIVCVCKQHHGEFSSWANSNKCTYSQ